MVRVTIQDEELKKVAAAMDRISANPRNYGCPKCGVPAGLACVSTRGGRPLARLHKERRARPPSEARE